MQENTLRSWRWGACLALLPVSAGMYAYSLTMDVAGIERELKMFGNAQTQVESMKLLDTIETLFRDGDIFLGVMITLFTLFFPISKYIATSYVMFGRQLERRHRVLRWIKNLGQWSMGDVFVVAFFVVWLKVNDLPGDVLEVKVLVRPGLYVFAASVLTSIVLSALLGFEFDLRRDRGEAVAQAPAPEPSAQAQ